MIARLRPLLVLLLCAGCACGAELAQLTNGFNVRCERHEELGGLTRLYLDAQGTGFVEVPTERVSGYEPAPELASQLSARVSTLPEHIAKAGLQTGIDPDFIHSVIWAESGYNARAVSPKGAQGLMQLMPATAAKLGVRDSFDPANNIDGGSRYLRELLLHYNGDAIKALAAYNAGLESVEKYQGVPPYQETRSYVARVINDFNHRKLCPNQPMASEMKKSVTGKDSTCQEASRLSPQRAEPRRGSRLSPQRTEPRRGPRLAASKPPVSSKDSKHPALKGTSEPFPADRRKQAGSKDQAVSKDHAVSKDKDARTGQTAHPASNERAARLEANRSTRAIEPCSAGNQLR